MNRPLSPIEQRILDALKEGDRSYAALVASSQSSYPEFNSALKALSESGLIAGYVVDQTTIAYTLLPPKVSK